MRKIGNWTNKLMNNAIFCGNLRSFWIHRAALISISAIKERKFRENRVQFSDQYHWKSNESAMLAWLIPMNLRGFCDWFHCLLSITGEIIELFQRFDDGNVKNNHLRKKNRLPIEGELSFSSIFIFAIFINNLPTRILINILYMFQRKE